MFKKIFTKSVVTVFGILAAAGLLTYADRTLELNLGLDLQGGAQLDYRIDLSEVPEADRAQIVDGVQEVIRRRVDSLGVSEPSIYSSDYGDEQHVIVELAGITDVNEAKETVGKTIQLEFKEENPNPNSAEKAAEAKTAADAFSAKVKGGADFKTSAESEVRNNSGNAVFTEGTDFKNMNDVPEALKNLLKTQGNGAIVGPIEIDAGYTVDAGGNLVQSKGWAIAQIIEKKTEEQENKVEAEVSARHILIAYKGAERSSATRTKEEAQTLANELSNRIKNGEKLEDLAKEFSDDSSGKEGGDLGAFKKGVMAKEFEETAFATPVNQVSNVVETKFGFHLIQPYNKVEESTTIETIEKVKYSQILFSTLPDPWKKEAAITGAQFKHADVSIDSNYQPVVSISFTPEGAALFQELTKNNIDKKIAIFVGGTVISAPTVNGEIVGGQAQITGRFTIEEAQNLARDLNTGAIPAPVELAGQSTISASLGSAALQDSLWAGFIGFAILGLFMILYYRLPGLIAMIALTIYSLLLVFLIKISLPVAASMGIGLLVFGYLVYRILANEESGGEKFMAFILACVVLFFLTSVLSTSITLTLAGIAGVLLSIGMAVDANILIFERMKEEMRSDLSLDQAIADGFKRAWDSIRDSNFSSLITCAILFYFGSSLIRGFALNLALGILVSMFSAITLSQTLLHVAAATPLSKNLWLFGKDRKKEPKHRDFMKYAPIWMAGSALITAGTVVLMLVFGFKLGLDFKGGSLLELKTTLAAQEVNTLSPLLEEAHTVSTDQGTVLIRTQHLSDADYQGVISDLRKTDAQLEEVRFTSIGPTIGKTLQQRALWALVLTAIFIVLYISFAFRKIPKEVSPWRFGVSAIVALVHDLTVMIGVFVLLGHFWGVEVDALFVTALLTIMGFSVHDTIVVFDRIRENLRFRKAGESLRESANRALNQTLARSINTSLSVFIMVASILFFGPESIFYFVLALTIGLLVGTYSSIFVAAPILVWWTEASKK